MNEEGSDAAERLPDDLLAAVRALDEYELRTLLDVTQRRLREVHPAISDRIDRDDREDIVDVEEGDGVARVLRREALEDSEDVPVLYLVTEERTPEGETRLHWTYLGPIQDRHGDFEDDTG